MPGVDWFFNPLTRLPSQAANAGADMIDNPQGEGGYLRGGLAGMMQGAGNVASDMTSPFSLATSAIPALSRMGNLRAAAGAGASAVDNAGMSMMNKARQALMGGNKAANVAENNWGSIYQNTAPKRLPDSGNMMPSTFPSANTSAMKNPVGPSQSEQFGQMLNRIFSAQKAMDRTGKINAAASRSRRLRPGMMNPEY